MESKVNYALVGTFVVLLGSVFILVTLWLAFGQRQLGGTTYVAYMTESVAGLNVGAPVRYRGVRVGRVSDIALAKDDPSRVRLLLDIAPGTPIKVDTVAVLSSQGLTGIAQIDLTGGTRNSAPLTAAPGEQYPEIRTGPSLFHRLDKAVFAALGSLESVSTEAKSVSKRVDELLSDDNLAAVHRILSDLREVSEALAGEAGTISRSIRQIDRLSANAARTSEHLPDIESRLNTTLEAVRKAGVTVVDAANAVSTAAAEVDKFAVGARQDLAGVSEETIPQINDAVARVRDLAETLNRLAGEIERNPSLLLQGRRRQPLGPGE